MMAFAETEYLACLVVRAIGYSPLAAGKGLIGLSNSMTEYGPQRARNRAMVEDALRFGKG